MTINCKLSAQIRILHDFPDYPMFPMHFLVGITEAHSKEMQVAKFTRIWEVPQTIEGYSGCVLQSGHSGAFKKTLEKANE